MGKLPELTKRGITGPAAGEKMLPTIKNRKPLAAFAPAGDPLDESKYPGDPNGDAETELNQLQAGFRDRMAAEASRFKHATDGSYYGVLCFESGDQLTAFLKALGMDKGGDLFIDGRAMADRMGIDLPSADIPYRSEPRIDSKLSALVKPSFRKNLKKSLSK